MKVIILLVTLLLSYQLSFAVIMEDEAPDEQKFYFAAYHGDLKSFKQWIGKHKDINLKPLDRGRYSKTALHAVLQSHEGALSDRLEIAKLLLEQGADSNARDYHGKTPLIYAVEENIPEAVTLLLAYKADPSAHDNRGYTALTYVTSQTNLAIEYMIKHELPYQAPLRKVRRFKKESAMLFD